MNRNRMAIIWAVGALDLLGGKAPFVAGEINPNPPNSPVKLIFIHHSTGENWLADDDGGLGIALRNNHYFVSDTNYGWGPDGVGDLHIALRRSPIS